MAPKFTLNLQNGAVSINLPRESARELRSQIDQLMERLKLSATKSGPKSQASLEYQHTGEVFLEIFCNPNIWPSPFAAKVLITLRDDRIKLTTEAELSRLIEDLNQYLEQI